MEKKAKGAAKTDARPYYDTADCNRIRRSLALYIHQQRIGIPKLHDRINKFLGGGVHYEGPGTVNLKTVQRFMSGQNVRNSTLKSLEAYAEHVYPLPAVDNMGEAIAQFFIEGQRRPRDWNYLPRNLTKEYDGFLHGRYIKKNPRVEEWRDALGYLDMKKMYELVYPEKEYIWEEPFEVPYNKIFFKYVPTANYVRVTEFVFNENFSNRKEDVEISRKASYPNYEQLYQGVLISVSDVDLFLAVMQADSFGLPKVYILEAEKYVSGEPGKVPFFGRCLTIPEEEERATRVRSGKLKLIPRSTAPIGNTKSR